MRPVELGPLGLAPAHLDAHRAGAAVPARARRRARVAGAAARHRPGAGRRSSTAQHPTLAPWYDRLSLFDVYSSPWFAAIYLLLFISLVGCVLPRSRLAPRQLRARPPRAPRNLARLPRPRPRGRPTPRPTTVLDAAGRVLRRRRFRVDTRRRLGRRREGLPARDRQPALPPGAARAARRGRLRRTCSATRATSSSSRARLLQHACRPTTRSTPGAALRRAACRRSRSS